MKKSSFLLLFLSLSVFASAVGVSDVNLLASSYLNESEMFAKTSFNLSDGQYFIISIGNEQSFILAIPNNGSLAMITSKEGIRNALIGYYATTGTSKEDLKINKTYSDEMLSLIDSYNKSRAKEFESKTYIGIDRFPCVDLETCWRACYTPVCQQMKIGAGKTFLELLWAFANSSSYIDSNISVFNEKVSSLSEFSSLQQIDELVLLVDNMRNNSITINNNDLLNPSALGFCPLINYNLSYLTSAKIKLLTTRDKVLPLLTVDETTDKIFNNTLERISMKSQLKIDKLCSNLISSNSHELSSIKANLSSLNTSKVKEKIDQLEKLMRLEGCSKMTEAQIQSAQAQVSNFTNDLNEYAKKLREVLSIKIEAGSAIAGMQGDIMLSSKFGELNSRFNDLTSGIDSAELSQLPDLESQLLGLTGEVESANNNKLALFISSIVTSPFAVILVVLVLALAYLVFGRKSKNIKK